MFFVLPLPSFSSCYKKGRLMGKSHATSQKMACNKVALAYLPLWGYKVLPNEKRRGWSRLER